MSVTALRRFSFKKRFSARNRNPNVSWMDPPRDREAPARETLILERHVGIYFW